MNVKNRQAKVIIPVFVMVLALTVFTDNGAAASAAAGIAISRTQTTLYPGDSETLVLNNTTASQKRSIKWKSSKKAVVSVTKKGKITAKKVGKAKISARLSGRKYTCSVTVKSPKVTYVEPTKAPAAEGNQLFQSEVSKKMTSPAYWYNKVKDHDAVLMDRDDIIRQNELNIKEAATHMNDLVNMNLSYNSDDSKASLSKALMSEVRGDRIGTRTTIYRDGKALDTAAIDAWFAEMKANIDNAVTSAADTKKYGICVRRADVGMAPTADTVGWSATDPDSEFINSALNVNEPVITGITTADGKFTYVYTLNCNGWVLSENIAICDSKEEWKAQWDLFGKDDVLIVTGSHVQLEKSDFIPSTSGLDLYFGTILPLVPKSALTGVAERYPWYSYSVYIPVRGTDGKMVRQIAMIASNQNVSIGFPEMTVRNLITAAFNCLGDRYGWGGMLGAMDCSLYTRNIYRIFGLEIARNTSWQTAMPCLRTDLSAMTEADKKKAISKATPGSLLMFPGHITMYLGDDGGKQYVISDVGSLAESTGEDGVKSVYAVSINSLNVRRRSGNTWLQDMTWVVTPFESAK
ncbi:MAG: SH3 domain-containing protein [Eubacterium sp.]|nr:SH3 domain-containing protein [Eubacterium sp.]